MVRNGRGSVLPATPALLTAAAEVRTARLGWVHRETGGPSGFLLHPPRLNCGDASDDSCDTLSP
jgi:hypothetical protein